VKLQVGLIADTLPWQQMLLQEGVPFVHADLTSGAPPDLYSVLVINRMLSANERSVIEEYLRRGGAVLGDARHMERVARITSRSEKLDFLVSDGDLLIPDVHMLDLGVVGAVPVEANQLRTQSNTHGMFAGPCGGGFAVVLPFDVPAAMCDTRTATKNFYSDRDRLPAEAVSLVSKGELRHLLHRSLEYLHHARSLPYAHLWYFPRGNRNLFVFRIDTDAAPERDVEELYTIAREHDVSISWFVDVGSAESWLRRYALMVGQELGVHCYEHQTYPTFEANLKNIDKAKRAIEALGVCPVGFAAPYGAWNPELAKAIDHLAFEYSSEFSFAYDTFPLYPGNESTRFQTLQVPIHPICIGSLKRAGFMDKHMTEYYRATIERKLLRNEPLFFYHHPSHRSWDVMEYIFSSVEEKGIDNITMCEYARWWKERQRHKLSVSLEGDVLFARSDEQGAPRDNVWLRLSRIGDEEIIAPLSDRIDMKSAGWSVGAKPLSPPADIRRIREFDPRAMLGDLYGKMMRKLK